MGVFIFKVVKSVVGLIEEFLMVVNIVLNVIKREIPLEQSLSLKEAILILLTFMVLYFYRNIIQKLMSPLELLPQICKISYIRSFASVILLSPAFIENYRKISLCDGQALSFSLLAFFFIDLSSIINEPLIERLDEFRLMEQKL